MTRYSRPPTTSPATSHYQASRYPTLAQPPTDQKDKVKKPPGTNQTINGTQRQPQPDGERDPRGHIPPMLGHQNQVSPRHLPAGRKRWKGQNQQGSQATGIQRIQQIQGGKPGLPWKGNPSYKKDNGHGIDDGKIVQHKGAPATKQRPQRSHSGRGC